MYIQSSHLCVHESCRTPTDEAACLWMGLSTVDCPMHLTWPAGPARPQPTQPPAGDMRLLRPDPLTWCLYMCGPVLQLLYVATRAPCWMRQAMQPLPMHAATGRCTWCTPDVTCSHNHCHGGPPWCQFCDGAPLMPNKRPLLVKSAFQQIRPVGKNAPQVRSLMQLQ